jgi:hypothetical protein
VEVALLAWFAAKLFAIFVKNLSIPQLNQSRCPRIAQLGTCQFDKLSQSAPGSAFTPQVIKVPETQTIRYYASGHKRGSLLHEH